MWNGFWFAFICYSLLYACFREMKSKNWETNDLSKDFITGSMQHPTSQHATKNPREKGGEIEKATESLWRIHFDLFMPHQEKIKRCWSGTICCWGKRSAQNAWHPQRSKAAGDSHRVETYNDVFTKCRWAAVKPVSQTWTNLAADAGWMLFVRLWWQASVFQALFESRL